LRVVRHPPDPCPRYTSSSSLCPCRAPLTPQLMGHSMGAAPILAAVPLLQKKGYTVPGIIVLDVVEGEQAHRYVAIANCHQCETPSFSSRDHTVCSPWLTVWPCRRHRCRVVAAHERYPVFSPCVIPLRCRRHPLAVSGVEHHVLGHERHTIILPSRFPITPDSFIPTPASSDCSASAESGHWRSRRKALR
jgi:hypothetical protein